MKVNSSHNQVLTTLNKRGGGGFTSINKRLNTTAVRARLYSSFSQAFFKRLSYPLCFSAKGLPSICNYSVCSRRSCKTPTSFSLLRREVADLFQPLCLCAKRLRMFFEYFANTRNGCKTLTGFSPRRKMSIGFLQILRQKINDVLSWLCIISGKSACLYRPVTFVFT